MAVGREEAAIVLEPGSATDRILRKGTVTAMQSLSDAPLTATLGGAAMPRFQDAHDQRAGAAAAAREFEDEVSNPSDGPLARPGRARHTPSGLHQLSRRYPLHTNVGDFEAGSFVWFPEGFVVWHGAIENEDVDCLHICNKTLDITYAADNNA